jgi:CheY-like chemotaxis protein
MTIQDGTADGVVLIVDDDELIRDTLRELVEMTGCTAVLAANGREALKIMADRRPCLVIVDLLMPVMTGGELIEEMRKEPALSGIPVIVSTSAPHRAPAGVPVVKKPVDIDIIVDWIRQTCRCAASKPAI